MIKKALAICLIAGMMFSLPACGTKEPAGNGDPASSALPTPEATPRPEDEGTGYTTIHEGGRKIESDEIVSFSLNYDQIGFYDEDSERYDICRAGRYSIEMKADEAGNALCSLNFKDLDGYGDPVEIQFTAGPEAFTELQQVLTDAGILAINGFSGWDSALGTYVKLKAEYATGEKLSVYGEGGASAYPPADIDAVIVYFNELAERNGLRFTYYPGERELTALFNTWLEEILPPACDPEAEEVRREYDQYDDIADMTVAYDDPDDIGWGAYARYDRQSTERRRGYYYYSGTAGNDEMMSGFLAWIRENCPGAEERENEIVRTNVNFEGSMDTVQLVGSDSTDNGLWEVYAVFDREKRTIFDIRYYRVTAKGETEEYTYEETVQLDVG